MRRRDRQTSTEQALEIISEASWAVLSVVDAQGRPYGTPVSPVLLNGALYFHGAQEGGARSRALDVCPEVSLCAVSRCEVLAGRYALDFESTVVRGRCSRVTDLNEAKAALRAIAKRYDSQADAAKTEEVIKSSLEKTAVWRIDIVEISGKARQPRGH